MPRLSSKYLTQIQNGAIPNPADLSPEERQHLMSQPWFQKALDMRQSGAVPTPGVIQKLMTQPGSQGFDFRPIDPQDPSKGHILVDLASGKTVSHEDIIHPAFKPELIPQKDEQGNIIGYGMTTSPSSAVPYKQKPDNELSKIIKPGMVTPSYVNGKMVGIFANDGTGPKFHMPMDPMKAMLSGGGGDEPPPDPGAVPPVATPSPSATPPPFGVGNVTFGNPPPPQQQQPVAPVQPANPAADFEAMYNNLPPGARYQAPNGKTLIKGGGQ